MSRRVQYSRNFGRFRVVDETVTTWAIKDTHTGEIVEKGLEHYEASLKADDMNATSEPGEQDYDPAA